MAYKIKRKFDHFKSENLPIENILQADRKTYIGKRKEPKGKDVVFVQDYDGNEHAVSMEDLASFFVQARGFPTILRLGNVYGEGQSGGREVSDMAHEVENKFVQKYGVEGYRKKMKATIDSIGG